MQICTLEWDFFFFSFHHFHDKSRVDYINIIATRQFISRWLLLGLEKGGFFLLPSKTKWSDNYLAIWPALFDNNYSSFRRSPTNSGRWGLRVSPTTAGWGIIPSLSGRKNVAGAGSEGRGSGAAPLAAQGLHKSSTQPRWARGELFNKGRGERIALGVGEAFQTPGWKKKNVCSFCSVALRHEFNMALSEMLLSGRRRWHGFLLRPTANLGSFSFVFIYLFRWRGRGIFWKGRNY